MGKASKKVKRQVQKKAGEQQFKMCQGKEQELLAAFTKSDYAKVLELLADLITDKDIKPDLMYRGAYSYFMLGDYERAAQWVTNTLNYDGNNIDARILLARLCFIQNRHDDGLTIFDFLIENYHSTLSMEQREQIMDSSEYYVRREAQKLRQQYPHLADFLQVAPAETAAVVSQPQDKPQDGKPLGESSSAISALSRLKAKLQALQEKDKPTAVQQSTSVPETSSDAAASPNRIADNVEQQIEAIKEKKCSLREKVQILNKFAGAQYMAEDYVAAERYLKEALLLDEGDCRTLSNMAMTQAAMGRDDKAQAFAAQLTEVDFILLRMLKEQAHG